jgi:hypothetical protein
MRQWFLVAGTLVLAGCGSVAGVCDTPRPDAIGPVECSDARAGGPTVTPEPRVGDGEDRP